MHIPKFKTDLKKLKPELYARLTAATGRARQALDKTSWVHSDRQVVCVDRLDERHFTILAQRIPKFKQLAERALAQYPVFANLLQDIYFSLYLPRPRLRPRGELSPPYRMNADLMHRIQRLDTWAYSRDNAMLNEGLAIIGTVHLAEAVLQGLPEEAKDEAQQAAGQGEQAEGERDALEQLLQQLAQMMAQAGLGGEDEGEEGEGAGGASGAGDPAQESQQQSGTPGGGGSQQQAAPGGASPEEQQEDGQGEAGEPQEGEGAPPPEPTPEEAAAIAALEEALSQLEQATQTVNDLEEPNPELPEEGEEKLGRSLRRGGKQANDALDGLVDMFNAWGVEPAEWNQLPIGDRMDLAEKLTKIPALKEFAAEIGRHRHTALDATLQPGANSVEEIVGVEIGGDLEHMLDSELAALVDPDLELLLLARVALEEVLIYEYAGQNPSGQGPFVLGLDISGSMMGTRERWAKAFAIAALEIARKDNRDVALAFFDTEVKEPVMIFPGGRASLQEKLFIAQSFSGGGTNWRPFLEMALANIEDAAGEWKSADIVMVTDGECRLPDDFCAQYVARCQAKGIRTHGLLLDLNPRHIKALEAFCDQAWSIQTVQGVGAAEPIFRQLALKP